MSDFNIDFKRKAEFLKQDCDNYLDRTGKKRAYYTQKDGELVRTELDISTPHIINRLEYWFSVNFRGAKRSKEFIAEHAKEINAKKRDIQNEVDSMINSSKQHILDIALGDTPVEEIQQDLATYRRTKWLVEALEAFHLYKQQFGIESELDEEMLKKAEMIKLFYAVEYQVAEIENPRNETFRLEPFFEVLKVTHKHAFERAIGGNEEVFSFEEKIAELANQKITRRFRNHKELAEGMSIKRETGKDALDHYKLLRDNEIRVIETQAKRIKQEFQEVIDAARTERVEGQTGRAAFLQALQNGLNGNLAEVMEGVGHFHTNAGAYFEGAINARYNEALGQARELELKINTLSQTEEWTPETAKQLANLRAFHMNNEMGDFVAQINSELGSERAIGRIRAVHEEKKADLERALAKLDSALANASERLTAKRAEYAARREELEKSKNRNTAYKETLSAKAISIREPTENEKKWQKRRFALRAYPLEKVNIPGKEEMLSRERINAAAEAVKLVLQAREREISYEEAAKQIKKLDLMKVVITRQGEQEGPDLGIPAFAPAPHTEVVTLDIRPVDLAKNPHAFLAKPEIYQNLILAREGIHLELEKAQDEKEMNRKFDFAGREKERLNRAMFASEEKEYRERIEAYSQFQQLVNSEEYPRLFAKHKQAAGLGKRDDQEILRLTTKELGTLFDSQLSAMILAASAKGQANQDLQPFLEARKFIEMAHLYHFRENNYMQEQASRADAIERAKELESYYLDIDGYIQMIDALSDEKHQLVALAERQAVQSDIDNAQKLIDREEAKISNIDQILAALG